MQCINLYYYNVYTMKIISVASRDNNSIVCFQLSLCVAVRLTISESGYDGFQCGAVCYCVMWCGAEWYCVMWRGNVRSVTV